jgi:hypothetical protein
MRFFLKVLVLVGLIVIGKLAKQTTTDTTSQAENISLPSYSKNNDNGATLRPAGLEKDVQPVSYYFTY